MSVETLRDRFAMAALTGLLAGRIPAAMHGSKDFAEQAYTIADAMLAARGDAAPQPQPTGDAVKQQMFEALKDALHCGTFGKHNSALRSIEAAILAAEKEATP